MLDKIQHIVVLMLENRPFDHMLGLLCADASASFPDRANDTERHFMPGVDSGEHFQDANTQLFGTAAPAPNDFASARQCDHQLGGSILPAPSPSTSWTFFPPSMLSCFRAWRKAMQSATIGTRRCPRRLSA
jgi:hypothetical protein